MSAKRKRTTEGAEYPCPQDQRPRRCPLGGIDGEATGTRTSGVLAATGREHELHSVRRRSRIFAALLAVLEFTEFPRPRLIPATLDSLLPIDQPQERGQRILRRRLRIVRVRPGTGIAELRLTRGSRVPTWYVTPSRRSHRSHGSPRSPWPRRFRLAVGLAVLTALVTTAAGVMVSVARGATSSATTTSAQFTATVPLAVASITISPDAGTFAGCSGPDPTALTLPNGTCTATVSLTEGGGAADIYAASTAASPSDGGADWALCIPSSTSSTPACSGTKPLGSGDLPGVNEFAVEAGGGWAKGTSGWLSSQSSCVLVSGSCDAVSGSQTISLRLYGPQQSTDDSTPFSFNVNLAVVPA